MLHPVYCFFKQKIKKNTGIAEGKFLCPPLSGQCKRHNALQLWASCIEICRWRQMKLPLRRALSHGVAFAKTEASETQSPDRDASH